MNLFWSKNPAVPNFGDDINPYLFLKLFGVDVNYVPSNFQKPHCIGIGSVLHHANNFSTIIGTGFMAEEHSVIAPPAKIIAVRGKETRRKLLSAGIDCPEVYGDVALLLPRVYNPPIEKKYVLGIIPHFIDKDISLITEPGVIIIDIQNTNHFKFIDDVRSCYRIASSTLHGLIIADAYGIPSVWLELSKNVIGDGFKFRDYFSSVGFDKKPFQITEDTCPIDLMNTCEHKQIQFDADALFNTINEQIER